jgi:hypothetical protein
MTPVTMRPSFSFHVGSSNPDLIVAAATLADAVTVSGKSGPKAVRALRRRTGFDGAVLFDRCGYMEDEPDQIDVSRWLDEQRSADADRLLTVGRLVRFTAAQPDEWIDPFAAEIAIAAMHGATALIALDGRILARFPDELTRLINNGGVPVALVLVDAGDPLGLPGATDGLSRLVRRVDALSVIRADHGAIAVPAFDGAHASMGLSGSTRHYSAGRGGAKPTPMNRVFVPYYLDWFTADLIAGWAAANKVLQCHLPCCNGQRLDRFFDLSLKPRTHNMTALAAFGDEVLGAEPQDRARTFLDLVAKAHSRYDIAGLHGPTSKAQLNSWALL